MWLRFGCDSIMATELSTGAKCCRGLFIALNALFLLIGLAVLALGIWLVVIGSSLSFLTGNSYFSGAAVFIVVGGVTALICALGFVAGICSWRILLGVFLSFVVLLLLLEIVAAVLGFVYRAELTNDVIKSRFNSTVEQYSSSNNGATVFVNAVQSLFECCGVNSYTDFFNDAGVCNMTCNFPASCGCSGSSCVTFDRTLVCSAYSGNTCGTVSPPQLSVYNQGCYNILIQNIDYVGYIVGGVGVVFGVLEIVAIMVACGLIFCITNSEKEVHV